MIRILSCVAGAVEPYIGFGIKLANSFEETKPCEKKTDLHYMS